MHAFVNDRRRLGVADGDASEDEGEAAALGVRSISRPSLLGALLKAFWKPFGQHNQSAAESSAGHAVLSYPVHGAAGAVFPQARKGQRQERRCQGHSGDSSHSGAPLNGTVEHHLFRRAGGGFVGDIKPVVNNGYVLAAMLLGLQLMRTLSMYANSAVVLDLKLSIKAAVADAVYAKSLRLSSRSRQTFSSGMINSLISHDVDAVVTFLSTLNELWAAPLEIALGLYYFYQLLGDAMWTAAMSLLFFGLVQFWLMPRAAKSKAQYMTSKDDRIRKLREYLYGNKMIKYEALEEVFYEEIAKIREKQLHYLLSTDILIGFVYLCAVFQQSMSLVLAFIYYASSGGLMEAEIIFTALTIFVFIGHPLGHIPTLIYYTTESSTSYKRIDVFLAAPEAVVSAKPVVFKAGTSPDQCGHVAAMAAESDVKTAALFASRDTVIDTETAALPTASVTQTKDLAVKLFHASFTWERLRAPTRFNIKKAKRRLVRLQHDQLTRFGLNQPFSFSNLCLEIPRGSRVAIVRPVASGKSSLVAAIVGDMRKTASQAIVYGSRLREAIQATALEPDLARLPHGVQTHIDKKGVNLSGGQKARIAIARAIASDADIHVFDDPLSHWTHTRGCACLKTPSVDGKIVETAAGFGTDSDSDSDTDSDVSGSASDTDSVIAADGRDADFLAAGPSIVAKMTRVEKTMALRHKTVVGLGQDAGANAGAGELVARPQHTD
ncbi:ABC transporter type 1, transmembrane domain-containing protein [Entophlyctis helioformis]|nr:ABC transporter type 1, transmembrane domain-containing protein [Entophlyctis helioformis]